MEHEGDDHTNYWCFGTVTKGLLKIMEDLEVGVQVETIQTTYYWEQPEYWDESWRLEESCFHSNSSERASAKSEVKNSQGVNNPESVLENKTHNILRHFEIQTPNISQTTRPNESPLKTSTC